MPILIIIEEYLVCFFCKLSYDLNSNIHINKIKIHILMSNLNK